MINHPETRLLLEERLRQLTDRASQIDTTLRDPGSADWEERATENEDDEVLEDMGRAAVAESNRIRAALKRIDNGTYGDCSRCGDPIDEKRLTAIPYTALCVGCATDTED